MIRSYRRAADAEDLKALTQGEGSPVRNILTVTLPTGAILLAGHVLGGPLRTGRRIVVAGAFLLGSDLVERTVLQDSRSASNSQDPIHSISGSDRGGSRSGIGHRASWQSWTGLLLLCGRRASVAVDWSVVNAIPGVSVALFPVVSLGCRRPAYPNRGYREDDRARTFDRRPTEPLYSNGDIEVFPSTAQHVTARFGELRLVRARPDEESMPARKRPYLVSASFRPDRRDRLPGVPRSTSLQSAISAKIRFHPHVTFFVGENGSGKSTVLEAIAVALGFGPEGGTKNVQFQTTRSVSPLAQARCASLRGTPKPSDGYFLRAESFFNVATYMDEVGYLAGYGNRSLHERSHGESFMALLPHKLRGNGIYLLDEPEAALSPSRQMAALRAIHQLVLASSQFVIATHSPILLAYPNARIIQFDGTGLTEVRYEDTEHYARHARLSEQLRPSPRACC